ncbi:MAG: glutamate-5-semialdehyde dehydrogenase [Clostridia bacterium]|nr:glutamate-5-semialdehyde dehydrogenase [Clostridia bacterium]
MYDLITLAKNAKTAAAKLYTTDQKIIDGAIERAANLLIENAEMLKSENAKDIAVAKQNGKSEGFIDRLLLSDKVIGGVAEGLKDVAKLVSPVGEEVYSYKNEAQGISVKKINVPFGVVGMIYEARPNVTADAFSLCFKTKNAVILRGGSDAINSNRAMVKILRQALSECGIDENAVSLIEDTSHETAEKFMKLNKYVDLLIPRGGAKLIRSAIENSTIPIIETGTGNCHIFVDESANVKMAADVIFNAKTQRYSVCNACESLVIHEKIAQKVLPAIYERLSEKQVEMRCDSRAYNILKGKNNVTEATDDDFYTEYGDAIISVKVVSGVDEAIDFINEHSTKHSESIITENKQNAEKFQSLIDSSTVYVNASTRFTDGFVFGLGAEIGISTQKLHARGPMGLNALVTTKYLVNGNGAVRK